MTHTPELIAPAGDMDCARAAVANGANAVYFGLPRFNARMRADNFTAAQLPDLVRFLHAHGVRAYCALNVLIFTNELADAEAELLLLDAAGVDAVIVQDLGLARLVQALELRMEVHASTQMTITSAEGLKFVAGLGVTRAILARELALAEIAKCFSGRGSDIPVATGSGAESRQECRSHKAEPEIEVFVHGALCVAYSGQCLTSESLGQRSANRGECASACRLPYQLIVDGALQDLGDRRYLLSPQDLAAVREIPELIRLGVTGFKIEGRLKTPEYVAATCQVYRKAIDAAAVTADDWYKLEMAFSRGLSPGWLHGVNHQQLVPARFGTKRGPLVGTIRRVHYDCVEMGTQLPLKPGDGVVFDTGGDQNQAQGGRIWEIKEQRLYFERGHIDFKKLKAGDRVWKTSDMVLERELRRTFTGAIPKPKRPVDLVVSGAAGQSLVIEAQGQRVYSAMPLQTAFKRPLSTPLLRDQLGRLGDTDLVLGELHNKLAGQVILPVSELNRLRRELCGKLAGQKPEDGRQKPVVRKPVLANLLPQRIAGTVGQTELVVLCRTMEQLAAAVEVGGATIYLDFEDLRRYRDAVKFVNKRVPVFLATPRIQKPGEQGFFKVLEQAEPAGVLIRNLGGLDAFQNSRLGKVGDFSLNVANPLTAELLIKAGLERVTVSYDLNAQQVVDLLKSAPPEWFELVIHQHMPMFHMDHCVFAAFLTTTGTDHTNCGRPCDRHQVQVRDRVGIAHPVKADVGCRNTVYHAKAQSGAEFLGEFLAAGARTFRVELLDEDAAQTRLIVEGYRELLAGAGQAGAGLVRRLNAVRQLGVTSGTLTVLG